MFLTLNKSLKSVTNRQLLSLYSQQFCFIKTKTTSKSVKVNKNEINSEKVDKNVDYLGIIDSNVREISGLYDLSYDFNETNDKYKDLLENRRTKMNEQNVLVTTFGKVRLDSANEPIIHGHYDPDNHRLKFDVQDYEEKLNYSHKTSDQSETMSESNVIEEQYFGTSDGSSKPIDPKVVDNADESDIGFIDRQYFSLNPDFKPLIKGRIDFQFSKQFNSFLDQKTIELKSFESHLRRESESTSKPSEGQTKSDHLFDSPLKSELFSMNFETSIETNDETDEEFDTKDEMMSKIEEQMDIKLEEVDKSPKYLKSTPRSGAQYLADIQSGKVSPKYPKFTNEVKDFAAVLTLNKEKVDSKGFRVLSGQVFDYTKLTHEDIVDLLFRSILFNDVDILAINKPYGMSIHSKESDVSPVLTEYLPKLYERIDCQKLYTVHRLDKDTTGVLLLAKTQEKAKRLNEMFLKHEIIKRYICITRGVPDDSEGIIDIPLEIGRCDGKERMALRPEVLEEYKKVLKSPKSAKRAVTQYKVVTESENAALIEVWPKTGVKHQIRAHLGLGLRCPILGDHKYSHLDRMAPQKLTGDMLLALNVRQAKVRHIPMHLHAKQYLLPGAGSDGRNIFINAPLPHHFHKNMSKLRLRD